jgi:predicted permease
MSEFLRDLRFGVRLLVKSPLFTATAALLLAVGISANTLIFSLINSMLLRPLPVSHPENLVRLVDVHPNDFITWDLPYNFCAAAAARDADFSEVICQGEADLAFDAAFKDVTSTERVRVHLVSPNFFSSLGVRPYLGRVLTADDEHARAQNAVLSFNFWQRKFRGDASVIGRKIILAGNPFTVVGVAPESFNGLAVDTSPDLRVPAAVDWLLIKPDAGMKPAARPVFAQVFARLRSGVALERANAELDPLVHAAYEEESNKIYPSREQEPSIRSRLRLESIVNGVSTLRPQFSRGLEVLMAGVALLLLMACANVAGLLLARSAARAPEMGVRLALGASPARIVRQLLTEGLLLTLLGGTLGILFTIACLPLLARGLPPIRDRGAVLQPLAMHITIDLRVLGFALIITVLTAVLFAVSPALRCARADVASALRGGRTATRRLLTGNLIVTAQVAICTLILMGAALLVETLERMRSMNPGFDRDRIVTFTIDPSLKSYTREQTRAFSRSLLERAGKLPGVSSASIASRALMRGTGVKATIGVAGSPIGPNDFLNSSLNDVTPGYFDSMGMRLLSGRAFNWFDRTAATPPHKVIVNQAFARRFFPGKNPIGDRFGAPGAGGVATADNQIIGIVSDAKYRSLREPIPPTVYSPVVDGFASAFILHLRTRERPEAMIAPVREILHALDPELPVIEVRTLREEVEASLWQERLLALLSTTFGAIAALLASIGLYGALDYAVKSRTREIGVRMAVGAQPARIVGLFSRETLLLTASGIVLGLCAYAGATVWIKRILYDLRPWEPAAVVSVIFLVVLIAAISTAPAAIRAVRIDPASALRAE